MRFHKRAVGSAGGSLSVYGQKLQAIEWSRNFGQIPEQVGRRHAFQATPKHAFLCRSSKYQSQRDFPVHKSKYTRA